MSSAALKQMVADDAIFYPLAVKQYHAMIETGILPEGAPYELLDGFLIRKDRSAVGEDPMTIGHGHAWVVTKLGTLEKRLNRLGCHIRLQQPVTIPAFNEPEPDASIILGEIDDYRDRHPCANEVTSVIEVADASLQHDRIVKGRIYAKAGIPQYIIINLLDQIVEVHTDPMRKKGRYNHSTLLRASQRVNFLAARGRSLAIAVRMFLP